MEKKSLPKLFNNYTDIKVGDDMVSLYGKYKNSYIKETNINSVRSEDRQVVSKSWRLILTVYFSFAYIGYYIGSYAAESQTMLMTTGLYLCILSIVLVLSWSSLYRVITIETQTDKYELVAKRPLAHKIENSIILSTKLENKLSKYGQ